MIKVEILVLCHVVHGEKPDACKALNCFFILIKIYKIKIVRVSRLNNTSRAVN